MPYLHAKGLNYPPQALGRFLSTHGVHPEALASGRPSTAGELGPVHALRSALRELLDEPDETAAVARANRLSSGTGTGPVLWPVDGGHARWHVRSRNGAGLADELALLTATGLLSVIHTLGHERFRGCAAPGCPGVFVDTSRAGRRRYCEPESCGNRVNVGRSRARRRAERS